MTRYLFCSKFTGKIQFLPDKGHWNGVEHMIEYPQRTIVIGLFYSEESKTKLIGYADAEYLSDPHKVLSQSRYVFACGGTIISWRSMEQMLLCRNKTPLWSKSRVCLVEINDNHTFKKCVVFLWKRIYQPQCTKIGDIITRN